MMSYFPRKIAAEPNPASVAKVLFAKNLTCMTRMAVVGRSSSLLLSPLLLFFFALRGGSSTNLLYLMDHRVSPFGLYSGNGCAVNRNLLLWNWDTLNFSTCSSSSPVEVWVLREPRICCNWNVPLRVGWNIGCSKKDGCVLGYMNLPTLTLPFGTDRCVSLMLVAPVGDADGDDAVTEEDDGSASSSLSEPSNRVTGASSSSRVLPAVVATTRPTNRVSSDVKDVLLRSAASINLPST
mmetsp:Transcript_1578/g.3900  ORF Transcript_1578/g.3900 Transcript_1578/m.3900 type:complete len:238 (-) Transcript_1578:723-1436(-)